MGKISTQEITDLGNIASINRVFVKLIVSQPLDFGRIEIFCIEKGSVAVIDRMPITLNDVLQPGTFLSISTAGTYDIEFDASLFKTGTLFIRLAGRTTPIEWNAFLSCRVMATPLLKKKDPESAYSLPSKKIKALFVPVSAETLSTGSAKTVMLEIKTLSVPPVGSPFAEFRVVNVDKGTWLEAFDSLTDASSSGLNRVVTQGTYIRVTQEGTITVYYNITEAEKIQIIYTGANLSARAVMLEDTIQKPISGVYSSSDYKMKTLAGISPAQAVKTGSAKTLIVEVTPLTTPNTSAPYSELIVTDTASSMYLSPYDSQLNALLAPAAVNSAALGYYLRLKTGGKQTYYYDLTKTADVKFAFNGTFMSIRIRLIEVEMSLLKDKAMEVAYEGQTFILEKVDSVTVDCYMDTFVFSYNSSSIILGIAGYAGLRNTVLFNATNFPNLRTGSSISAAYVLPSKGGITRICIITNRGQIYHNYPYRAANAQGIILTGDHLLFDESVAWDLPTNVTSRRYPSKDPLESKSGFKYFPYLPDYAYEFTPGVNVDNGFGNGGYPAVNSTGSFVRSRFYQYKEPANNLVDNPWTVIQGSLTKTPKLCTLGVYQLSGSRVCIWGTEDGGRSMFVLYEFDSYVSFGNTINTSAINAYTPGNLSMQERLNNFPNAEVKEPASLFTFKPEILISSITNSDPAVVTTASPHGMVNSPLDKPLVRLIRKSGSVDDWDPLLNNTASETNAVQGTGVFFRVRVLTETTFELHENIYNPSNNLKCRHIHFTHPLKDFISFGTGEDYPYTWTLLLENRLIDAAASVNLDQRNPVSYRLNSAPNGIVRPCSFWMLDDDPENPTVFCGSDTYIGYRGSLKIPGRTNLPSRSSAGILKGKLSDIDDTSKFASVFDISEPVIYTMNLNNILIAGFQLGSNAVSLDMGNTWEAIKLGSQLKISWVDKNNHIYFKEGYRLRFK
ncbi:hypothetical protein [Pedobacter antarcticus]|uniref:hypothetical protein n=1 Tax=Pedobacter antarcticus TaxID=34086 RepID=UPI00115FBDBD|nr:hypothetical protein [Pedobacter antarcticus]